MQLTPIQLKQGFDGDNDEQDGVIWKMFLMHALTLNLTFGVVPLGSFDPPTTYEGPASTWSKPLFMHKPPFTRCGHILIGEMRFALERERQGSCSYPTLMSLFSPYLLKERSSSGRHLSLDPSIGSIIQGSKDVSKKPQRMSIDRPHHMMTGEANLL